MSDVKRKLENILGDKAYIVDGNSDAFVQYNIPKCLSGKEDFIIYLNNRYKIGVIWDYRVRRKYQNSSKSLTVNDNWKNIYNNFDIARDVYKTFKNGEEKIAEKVLFLDFEIILDKAEFLDIWLEFNADDLFFNPELF